MSAREFREIIYQCLVELSTEEGINASGRTDVYGCIFGRDSAITVLKILKAVQSESAFIQEERERLLAICRTTLLTLIDLQGQTVNLESGEEPGKCIHEYRKDNYERLLKLEKPWFVYPD